MLRLKLGLVATSIYTASLFCFSNAVIANGFGIYEAKTLALGGASVAIAEPGVAVFYNPALLAQQDYDEDRGRHGRFFFPTASVQIATSAQDLQEIDDDNLTDNLTRAIDQFNATPDSTSADAIVSSSSELLGELGQLREDTLFTDAFTGLVISEPGPGQGGAFYWGARVIGDGNLAGIEQADLNLLADYVKGLDFIASNGQRGAPHPELFDGNGNLVDPRDNLVSQTQAAGALINELGLSVAKRFDLWGQQVAFGLTPKLQLIKTFDATYDVSNDEFETGRDDKFKQTYNFDFGLATNIGRWNFGLTAKDLFRQNISTPLNQELIIDTKTRLGIGYLGNRIKVGLDYDIAPIAPAATGLEVQEVSLGVQWRVFKPFYLRAGYRQDLLGSRGDTLSYGFELRVRRFIFDFAIADGEDLLGAALQLGVKI